MYYVTYQPVIPISVSLIITPLLKYFQCFSFLNRHWPFPHFLLDQEVSCTFAHEMAAHSPLPRWHVARVTQVYPRAPRCRCALWNAPDTCLTTWAMRVNLYVTLTIIVFCYSYRHVGFVSEFVFCFGNGRWYWLMLIDCYVVKYIHFF